MSHLFIAAPHASPTLLDRVIEELTLAGVPVTTTSIEGAFAITVIGEVSQELQARILKEGPDLPLYSLREGVPTPKGLLTPSAVFDISDFTSGMQKFARHLWQQHAPELIVTEGPYVVVTSAEKHFGDWVVRQLRESGVAVWYGDHLDWESPTYDDALEAAIHYAMALVIPERRGLEDDGRVKRARAAAEAAFIDVRPFPMDDSRGGNGDDDEIVAALIDSLLPREAAIGAEPELEEPLDSWGEVEEEMAEDTVIFRGGDQAVEMEDSPPPVSPQPGITTDNSRNYDIDGVEVTDGVFVVGENNSVTLVTGEQAKRYAKQTRHFEAAFPVNVLVNATQMLRIAVRLPRVPSPFGDAEARGEAVASDEGREISFEMTPEGGYKPLPLRVDINAPGFEPHTDDASFTLHYEDEIAETEVALLALRPGPRVIVVTVLTGDVALATMKLTCEVVEEKRAGLNFGLGIVRLSLAFGR